MMAKRDKWGVFMQVLCLGLAFFMLFPILYAVSVSLMEQKAVLASPPHFLPPKVTFDNYVTAFTRTTLPRYMVNSFVVAVICSVSRVLVACMSAFAFSFMEFKGKKLLFFFDSQHHDDPAGCTDRCQFHHSKPFTAGEHIYGNLCGLSCVCG